MSLIKARSEDFRVEEILAVPLARRRPYAVYRVSKSGLPPLGFEAALASAFGIPRGDLAVPALKDRQAEAVQHVSVRVGRRALPPRVEGAGFTAEWLGGLDRPLGARDLGGNRFWVVLRNLPPTQTVRVRQRFERIAACGFPNYFDEQRFGSRTDAMGLPGSHLVHRNWEAALKAWITVPAAGDPPEWRELKALLAPAWGDFGRLGSALPRSHERSVVTYLKAHPKGFRRAVELVDPRLLGLWLSAWQSSVWNRVAGGIFSSLPIGQGAGWPWLEIAGVRLPLPAAAPDPVEAPEAIPLPHKTLGSLSGVAADVYSRVLAEEGIEPERLRGTTRAWLARASRRLWCRPGDSWCGGERDDELHPGRRRLQVRFTLAPGSYATLLLKCLETEKPEAAGSIDFGPEGSAR